MRRSLSINNLRPFSICVIMWLLAGAFMGILGTGPIETAAQSTGKATKTTEGWDHQDLTWSSKATRPGTPLVLNLSVTNGFEINTATINVTSEPVLIDPFKNKWEYPTNLSLSIGNRTTWEFPGTMGNRREFANASSELEKVFTAGDNEQYIYIPLPLNANLKTAQFDVINTQTKPYEYTMTIGGNQVWYRNSIGFSKTNAIETEFGVNDVAVMNIDPNYDQNLDLVGVGEVGYMYVVKHLDTEPTGYSPPIKYESSITRKDLTSLCTGDIDNDYMPDVAATNMNGSVYVWKNDGVNLVQTPETHAVAANKLTSCAFGDLNNDGMLDLAAGYLTGPVYYMMYNVTSKGFDAPNVVLGGSSAMNSLRIFDMDGDGFQDIVGGSSDTNFIFIRNTPKGTFEQGKPTPSGGESLNSIDVADLNGDGWADMVGASNDGSIYIAYSSGPGVFDPGVEKKASTSPMTRLILEDMDLDNDPDILAYSQDGYIYLIQNNYNFLGTPVKLLNVGPSVRGMAVGDLDGDMDKDLVLATGKGFEIWRNDFGPFEEKVSGSLTSAIQQYLDNCELNPKTCTLSVNENGVKITEVPIKIKASTDGVLTFRNLSIAYDLTTTIDIKESLVNYTKQGQFSNVGVIPVPLTFKSDSNGTLMVNGINIGYTEHFVAFIDSPKNNETFLQNQVIRFHAFSNKDQSGNSTRYNYTWNVVSDPKPFANTNNGLELSAKKVTKAYGNVVIRVTIRDTTTSESDSVDVPITIEEPGRPHLRISLDRSNLGNIMEGTRVKVRASIHNDGPVDCSDLNVFLKVDGKVTDEMPVWVGNGTKQVVEFWWTAKEGRHRLEVGYESGDPEPASSTNTTTSTEVNVIGNKVIFVGIFAPLSAIAAFLASTEIGRYATMGAFIPLYTRLKKSKVLDNFTRGQIHGFIVANPGAHMNLIRDKIKLSNGVIAYHLHVLEREGYVSSASEGLKRRFYPGEKAPEKEETKELTMAQSLLLSHIRKNPGISQTELAKLADTTPHVVNYHIRRLWRMGLVTLEKDGRFVRCTVQEDRLKEFKIAGARDEMNGDMVAIEPEDSD